MDLSSINICCHSASCPSPSYPPVPPPGLGPSCTLLLVCYFISRRGGVGTDWARCGTRRREVTQPGSPGQRWPRERTGAGLPPDFLSKAAVSHCAHSLVPSQSHALAGRIHMANSHDFSSLSLGQISPGITLHSSLQAFLKYPPGGPPQPLLLHLLSINPLS